MSDLEYEKNKFIAVGLALFLGGIGIHKFYLGENRDGVKYFLLCWLWIPLLFALVDAVTLLTMSEDEFDQRYNS